MDSPYPALGSVSFSTAGLITSTFTFNRGTYTGNYKFILSANGALNQAIWIKAVKLEVGSSQTLAHQENGVWVLNDVPNYAEELAKCQRYFFRWGQYGRARAVFYTADQIQFYITTPVPMRGVPSISGTLTVYSYTGLVAQTGFTITYEGMTQPNQIRIKAAKTSHGLTDAILQTLDSYVDFSADL